MWNIDYLYKVLSLINYHTQQRWQALSFTRETRYIRRLNQDLTPLETQVGTVIGEVESILPEIKGFQATKAVELPISEDKREKPAIIVFVPYHLHKTLQTHARKITTELEKKLKTTVLLVVSRTIQSRWIKVLTSNH